MIYLAASICCSVFVSVLLKVARRYGIDVRQAVAVNYAVASALCLALLQPTLENLLRPATPWGVLLALGVLLPSVFLAMAASVRHAGIVRSDAAQRLSLFIPLLAAFLLFGQTLSGQTLAGIAVAFAALACLVGRAQDGPQGEGGRGAWAWPLAVWLGYGVIDILFKQMARAGTQFAGGLLAAFVLAGIVITGYLLARRVQWSWRHAGGGLVLGLANFGNILFYIRAHQHFPSDPALVFSAMNIGVITLGTLVGAAFFKERLSPRNWLGVALAVAAVVVLIP
ncbi:EamA/RhaT family transporter [Orrella sp. JC864]|uniref:EamA family transporter n=1 Tax=Orrella sp. JC864 TaxID=3120298 RepID=UPI0012BCD9DA